MNGAARSPQDADAGDLRVRFAVILEGETRRHDARFRRAAAIGPGDTVLDIGCGTGVSTRDAAAASRTGAVLGVDITASSLEHARTAAAGLANATFEVADAQTADLGTARFDVVISRFGVMFFADPPAAFANIARAARPGGRLAFLVWRERDRNEWATAPAGVLGPGRGPLPALDPFSLADPDVVRPLLEGSGFADVGFEPVDEPVRYGDDVEAAVEFVLALYPPRTTGATGDDGTAREVVRRLVDEHHDGRDGVTFAASTWIITATRR